MSFSPNQGKLCLASSDRAHAERPSYASLLEFFSSSGSPQGSPTEAADVDNATISTLSVRCGKTGLRARSQIIEFQMFHCVRLLVFNETTKKKNGVLEAEAAAIKGGDKEFRRTTRGCGRRAEERLVTKHVFAFAGGGEEQP